MTSPSPSTSDFSITDSPNFEDSYSYEDELVRKFENSLPQIHHSKPFKRLWSVRDRGRLRAKVYTDGSCHNQGRPNATAGFGVFWGKYHPYNYSGTVDGIQDNNRAELAAAHYAIRQAIQYRFQAITIVSDSEFVKMVIERPHDFYKLAYKNYHDLIFSINSMRNQIDVSVEQVKSHSGNFGNEQADRLANWAAYSVDDMQTCLARTYLDGSGAIRRRSKSPRRRRTQSENGSLTLLN